MYLYNYDNYHCLCSSWWLGESRINNPDTVAAASILKLEPPKLLTLSVASLTRKRAAT